MTSRVGSAFLEALRGGGAPLLFDGAMGTQLVARGLRAGERPETWNDTRPEAVMEIHRAYLEAGARVVTANTFGVHPLRYPADFERRQAQGVRLARRAAEAFGAGFVAADMGALPEMIAPNGGIAFEDAVTNYARAARAAEEAGADFALVETLSDAREAKAAALGVREGSRLPLVVTLSFQQNGRLLTGGDARGAAALLEGLGADAVGLNCGVGPREALPIAEAMLAACGLPIVAQPNAALPVIVDGRAEYPFSPDDFARAMRLLAERGVRALGGCCGTTPAHIRALASACADIRAPRRAPPRITLVSGCGDSVALGECPLMIGERINPTGKKRFQRALREDDLSFLQREAKAQEERGARLLDVNVGMAGVDEAALLPRAVRAVQDVCPLPLQLDTASPDALSAAMRVYDGVPLVNSISGKRDTLARVLPLLRKYGGAAVALLLDDDGIPETPEARLAVARRILRAAEDAGVAANRLVFDALTMTVAHDGTAARTTLRTLRLLKRELGALTVLGVSNVSFGLPARETLNAGFLSMAMEAGLDAAILNPLTSARDAFFAAAALTGHDAGCLTYIEETLRARENGWGGEARCTEAAGSAGIEPRRAEAAGSADAHAPSPAYTALRAAILRGIAADASAHTDALLDAGASFRALVEEGIVPALTAVGEDYERGRVFLPQLLRAADAAQAAFGRVEARAGASGGSMERRGTVVVATVRGDVHDIGKNIAAALLRNHGFTVVDAGRDVPPERIAALLRESGARLCGLSALMTTTLPAMAETIALLRRELPHVRVMVGGAVLTPDAARDMGADACVLDAMASVRFAQTVYGDNAG